MEYEEPTTKAKQYLDQVYNGTSTITSCCQELMAIADAMLALGLPAGRDAYSAIERIRDQARSIASAVGSYTHAQANGTLYHAPDR